MPTTTTGLHLKFRKRDTQFGVTRETVKAMAERFDVSETEIVHMASCASTAWAALKAWQPSRLDDARGAHCLSSCE